MIYADIFRITLWQDLRQNAYYYGTVTHISQAGQQGDKMRYKPAATCLPLTFAQPAKAVPVIRNRSILKRNMIFHKKIHEKIWILI